MTPEAKGLKIFCLAAAFVIVVIFGLRQEINIGSDSFGRSLEMSGGTTLTLDASGLAGQSSLIDCLTANGIIFIFAALISFLVLVAFSYLRKLARDSDRGSN